MQNNTAQTVSDYFLQLQQHICKSLEAEEPHKKFLHDRWNRPQGGWSRTHVLEGGTVLEKGSVNCSHISGDQLPKQATDRNPALTGCHYEAMGVSVIVHPCNPYVPTTHANWRYFISKKAGQTPIWWFGGGFDLTPYYGFVEDCQHWHRTAKAACDPYDKTAYPKFKRACDQYFFLPHRQEPRGIGGLFFDDLNEWGFDTCFRFIQDTAIAFLEAYLPILRKRKHTPFQDREKAFQQYRRGRYVEFNLLYDRGTSFGLKSQGRTESILTSLPPTANWQYNWKPKPGSKEAELYDSFLVPKDWANIQVSRP